MGGFGIAALVSMLGGGFMQHQAQQNAAENQQRAIRDSLERQRQLQMQAEGAAMKKAQEFAPESRQEKQAQIEQQLTQEMLAPVQEAAVQQEAPSVQGDVSEDYTTARAKSQAEQMKTAEQLARIFGRIGSAGQLRQNEAIGLGDTGQHIGMLNNFSRGQAAADQHGIQAAGVPSGGAMLAGSLLQAGGQAGMMGAFDGLKAAGSNVWSGSGITPGAGGLGFKPTGGLGLNLNGGASSWMPRANTGFGSWVPKSI